MRRQRKKILFTVVAFLAVTFLLLRSFSTTDLIEGTLDNKFVFPPAPVFYFYATTFHDFEISGSELNPLHQTFKLCMEDSFQSRYCDGLIEAIKKSGVDVNSLSNRGNRLSILHLAIESCSIENIRYALEAGVDVNVSAEGQGFRYMTPLRYLNEIANCSNRAEINDFLRDNGAVSVPSTLTFVRAR